MALDAGQHINVIRVRRMERFDVDVEPVDSGVAGVVAHHADVVLIEALAVVGVGSLELIGSSTIASATLACGPVWLVAGARPTPTSGVHRPRWWPRWCR